MSVLGASGESVITKHSHHIVHPGDVRTVRAVDAPALRHLRNVIVFNVRGQRDLPNMYVQHAITPFMVRIFAYCSYHRLSGGDLCVHQFWKPNVIN